MLDIENLTIMFTDIVGFSDMVSSMSRNESEDLLKQHNTLLEKTIKQFRGQLIKSVGDSFLVVFRSPTDAVLCAMAMQDILWERNQGEDCTYKITIRIALNTGEVRLAAKDVFGEAVNIAARLESNTPPDAIYLTESVYLSMNKNEVELESVGNYDFKGIPEGIHVYQARNKKSANHDNEFSDYPYGGAHRHLKPASRSGYGVGKVFIGLSASIVAAFCSWWVTITYLPAPDSIEMDKIAVEYSAPEAFSENLALNFQPTITQEIRNKAETLINEKNYLGLKNIIEEYKVEYADNAYLIMLQGHVEMYYKQYENAVKHYQLALDKQGSLAWNPMLAKNLVKLLDHQREQANKLLGKHLTEPMIEELSIRSGKPGLRARYDAFYLLKDSGNIEKVDKVGLNIWDLRELDECRLKHVAVNELKRLKDPRALPALEEVVNVGFLKKFQYTCLRKDAKLAIELLQDKDKNNNNNTSKAPAKVIDESNTADFDKPQSNNLSAFEVLPTGE